MYVTQTLEKEKSSVHSGQLLLSPKRIEKKKKEIICPQHRKEKNSENN